MKCPKCGQEYEGSACRKKDKNIIKKRAKELGRLLNKKII